MTTFRNHSEAQIKATELTKENVHYTNEGLEIALTKSESHKAESIAKKLKESFSDVKIKGRIYKVIEINYISTEVKSLRLIKVTY